MSSNTRKSKLDLFIFWTICFSCTALVGLAVVGSNQELEGWVEPGTSKAGGAGERIYTADLQTNYRILRGNDLFWVAPAEIDSNTENLIYQHWFSDYSKGRVFFVAAEELKPDNKLRVRYRLQIRWSKLISVVGVAVLLACWMLLRYWSLETVSIWTARPVNIFFYVVSLIYVAIILFPVGWIPGDSHFIIASVVQGKMLPWTVFPEAGRFFPLGLFDLNLMLPFGDAPLVYQIERTILFLLLIGLLYYYAVNRIGKFIAGIVMLFFLTTPELLRTYADVIFAESILMVLLTLFFLSFDQVLRGGGLKMTLVACICALIATYCKEPVFGLFVVFATTMLLFDFKGLNRWSLLILCFLLINAVIFVTVYIYVCQLESRYLEMRLGEERISRWLVFSEVMKNPSILLASLVAIVRLGSRLLNRKADGIFEDATLFAGVAYVMAFVFLRFSASYYFLPAYVCWMIALVGYLKPKPTNVASLVVSSEARLAEQVKFDSCLVNQLQKGAVGLALVLAFFQIPNVIKGAEFVVTKRNESLLQTFVIRNLVEAGFDIYLYVPAEMPNNLVEVQKLRQTVINTSDANLRKESAFDLEDLGLPAVLLKESELPISGNKFIFFNDPSGSLVAVNQHLMERKTGSVLVPLDERLSLFGAAAFTEIDNLKTIQQLVQRLEERDQ